MKLSNNTYDTLNKIHRIVLVLIELVGVMAITLQALQNNSIKVPAIATTIIAVAQTVLGYLLHISSKAYWEDKKEEIEA